MSWGYLLSSRNDSAGRLAGIETSLVILRRAKPNGTPPVRAVLLPVRGNDRFLKHCPIAFDGESVLIPAKDQISFISTPLLRSRLREQSLRRLRSHLPGSSVLSLAEPPDSLFPEAGDIRRSDSDHRFPRHSSPEARPADDHRSTPRVMRFPFELSRNDTTRLDYTS